MTTSSSGRPFGSALLIAVVSLPLGYAVLRALQAAIHLLWVELPDLLPPWALGVLVLGVPTLAGLAVAAIRRRGDAGHSPLTGISVAALPAAEFPTVIGAIVVTLLGGLVLGPEVALVSTGSVIGTVLGPRGGLTAVRGATIGAVAAICALLVGPILSEQFSQATTASFSAAGLLGGAATASITVGVLGLGRLLALGVLRRQPPGPPRPLVLAGIGLLVGALALGYHLATGHEVALVLTSGETFVPELLALGSTSAILVTIAVKWAAYALCLGGGFRGGPFFPAMFVGAGIGAVVTALAGAVGEGAAAAGLTASIVYLARPRWAATVVIGAALGLLSGGVGLVPLGVTAAVVTRALPARPVPHDPQDAATAAP